MRALTVRPGEARSLAVEDVPDPTTSSGRVLVRALRLGVCGTDREIADGLYGEAPHGHERLVLGHESVGRVVEAPEGSGLAEGDLVVPMVRHPDPVPCSSCALGEWDMCRNGRFTEHGIVRRDGFGSESYRLGPERLVPVDPALGMLGVLLEPASVVAKAWEHLEHVGRRAAWSPRTVLVTGAGPIGLLAALLGAQRGFEVHVLDHNEDGPKPGLIRALGATHDAEEEPSETGLEPDIVIECTGVPSVISAVLAGTPRAGVTCLTGLSSGRHDQTIEVAPFNQAMVLGNAVVFGTVNANRRHYEAAAVALAQADPAWLEALITRVVPLSRAAEAIEPREGDVKVVVDMEA